MRFLILVAALAAAPAFTQTALAQTGPTPTAPAQTARLTVTGTGEVAGVPDIATIRLGVTREAPEAAEAMAALSEGTEAVLARLETDGIAPRDVQTTQLFLNPVYARGDELTEGSPRIAGYQASTEITVRVRDLDRLGGLLDTAVGDGANEMRGIEFALSDPAPSLAAARTRAVADAMEKAATLAEAAGLAVGDVISLTEGGESDGPAPAMARMAADMPVARGEVTQAVTVTLVVEMVAAE